MKHDEDCPGCKYQRRREINKVGVRMTDYKAKCAKCETDITGEFEHRVNRLNYCQHCVTEPARDILSVNCGQCGQGIEWSATLSNVSGGNGYTVSCGCGHVQEYRHDDISHKHIEPPIH
jgi:hypothetical protein